MINLRLYLALVVAGAALARAESPVRLSSLDLNLVDEFIFFNQRPPRAAQSASGGAIIIGGRVFADGFGVRGSSRWQLQLDGKATQFHAWTGMTDDSKEPGPVWYEVYGDGRVLYSGDPLVMGSPAREVTVDIAGVRSLVLVVVSPDHIQPSSAWADATIDYSGAAPVSVAMPAEKPYILTPAPSPLPRINGAKVFGARPGHPVLFIVPATGERPITFAAKNLPDGLTLDPTTGQISGSVALAGSYRVVLTAANRLGQAEENFRLVIGDKLALTPPMGWNSWNCFAQDVSAADIRAATDAVVASGFRDHGWAYVNTDDFWTTRPVPGDSVWKDIQTRAAALHVRPNTAPDPKDPTLIGPARDAEGRINPNSRFPDMAALVDYIHSHGMRAGIYSSPGPLTCGLCTSSYGHEAQDAQRWAEWGFDYLKYDWCSYHFYAADESLPELVKPYALMGQAVRAQNRDIVFSLCQYGMGDVWRWGAAVDGNLWRTTTDILDSWASMAGNGFSQSGHEVFSGPGRWNDPDMLVVGKLGWGRNLHPTRLTPDEQYTHMSLWCLQAAPLLIGCDLTQLDDFTRSLLTNDEVLEVDQDALGRPAGRIVRRKDLEIWSRPLEDGSIAVGLFNRGELPVTMSASWGELGIEGPQDVRDLWRQKDLGVFRERFSASVPRHGVVLVKISRVESEQATIESSKWLPALSSFVHPDTVPDTDWHSN